MLERTIQPSFGKIEDIKLMEPKVHHLDNGIPIFSIDAGAQEVLRIELVFDAGTACSDQKLVASATNKLLTEGTTSHSAKEIAESVDFFGAYLETDVSHDDSSLVLYTLSKHLKSTIGTLAEVYFDANFPERELETYLLKHKQEQLVNEQKVSYLCAKGFSAALFGTEHPYGRSADISDYDQIGRDALVQFHESSIRDRVKYILVAGKLTDTTISQLNSALGQSARKPIPETIIGLNADTQKQVHVEKTDAVQNAIKIGRVLFPRTHPDHVGVQILSVILGGYFGSRLMANIREDKGYTYGIHAGIASLKHSGYLTISTEVGADVCDPALDEIFKEIEKLRNDLIPTQELELVRNYMLGSVLKSIDGPFNLASKWHGYLKHGLGTDAHDDLIHRIKTITPERLRELANTYLQRKDLVQVTAGKPF
ncbi:MAG: insulinase family protein [Flavobacteriales bacterium]|nr:insulinase family protein [Flavobacteriales bacterium]